jgi:predicted DNA-binding ribbon-helix-helix protein
MIERASRPIQKRSIRIAGHSTSLSLEAEFWTALRAIARRRGLSLNRLVASIDTGRRGNLSSALRVFVLQCYERGELGPSGASGSDPANSVEGS